MSEMMRYLGVPGSGKTQQLKRQVEAWVDRDGISADRIVLTSFTRAAANVLRGRVPVPTQNTATLHSFAFRGIGHCLVADGDKDLIKQWNESGIPESWRIQGKTRSVEDESLEVEPMEEGGYHAQYALWRALGRVTPLPAALSYFVARWDDFKAQTASIDFQDMIDHALTSVDVCPGDPDCFVVDEAQDLNPTQWALVQKWGAAVPHRFVVAGDPAQVLYSWIGASPDHLLAPLPPERSYLLGHSYRNPRKVQADAEGWLRQHSGTMCDGRYATPDDRDGGVYHMPVNYQDPEALVGAALRHMAEGQTTAILSTCGFYLTPLIAKLREFGVPFHNPYRPAEGKWNPLRRLGEEGDTTSSVQRLRCWLGDSPSGPKIVTALEQLPAVWFRGTRKAALEQLMQGATVTDVLQPAAADAWGAGDGGWYAEHMPEAKRRPLELAWNIYRRDPALLDKPPTVIVGTIHSIKGGEADNVYLLPDLPRRVVNDAQEDMGVRDAVVRQWYVGITRAREAVYYCEPERFAASVEAI